MCCILKPSLASFCPDNLHIKGGAKCKIVLWTVLGVLQPQVIITAGCDKYKWEKLPAGTRHLLNLFENFLKLNFIAPLLVERLIIPFARRWIAFRDFFPGNHYFIIRTWQTLHPEIPRELRSMKFNLQSLKVANIICFCQNYFTSIIFLKT